MVEQGSGTPGTGSSWRGHLYPLLAISFVTLAFCSIMVAGLTFGGVGAQMYLQFPWAGVIDDEYRVGGRGFPQSDEAAISFPSSVFATEALRSGQLPLWVPYSYGGQSAEALDLTRALYPPQLFALILLNPQQQHNILLILHLLLAGAGMYGLLRCYGVNPYGSVFGALIWQFNGFSGFWLTRIDVVIAAAWLPVALLMARRAVKRGSFTFAALTGGALGLASLGGSTSLACLGALVTLSYLVVALVGPVWAAVRHRQWRCVLTLLGLPIVGVGLSAGISAVVWLPYARAFLRGERALLPIVGAPLQPLAWPDVLKSLIVPAGAATVPGELPLSHIQPLVPEFASLAFVGLPALVLAMVALVVLVLQRDRRTVVGIMTLVALVLGVESAWKPQRPWVIVASVSALPHAELFIFGFGVAMLAGIGLSWVCAHVVTANRAALLGVLVGRAVILAEAGQLLAFAYTSSPMQPAEAAWAYPSTPLVAFMQKMQTDRRILPLDQTLMGRLPLVFGLRSFSGDQADRSPELDRLWQAATTPPKDAASAPSAFIQDRLQFALLRTLSVGLIVGQPGATLLADERHRAGASTSGQADLRMVYAGKDGVVYQQADALPRVLAVPQVISVPDAAAALDQLAATTFDATQAAIVIGNPEAAAAIPRVGGPANLLPRSGMSAVVAATAPAGPVAQATSLRVTPNPPLPGTTQVTLNWDAGPASSAEIWVSQNGQPERIVTNGVIGTLDIPWITLGNTYVFRLYAGTDRETALNTVEVANTATRLQISPNPPPPGSTQVRLSWDAGAAASAELWVSQNDQPEQIVANGVAGTLDIPWIAEGSRYTFRLYGGTDRATVLNTADVPPAPVPASTVPAVPVAQAVGLRVSPNPPPPGSTQVTLSWDAGAAVGAQLWVSQNGQPEQIVASSPTGTLDILWISEGSTYTFRLYAAADRTTVLDAVDVAHAPPIVVTGLRVSPNPLPAGKEPVTLIWNAGNVNTAQVWVSQNDEPETLLAIGRSGTASLPWISPNLSYTFRLYEGEDRSKVIETVLAARGRAAVHTSATEPVVVEPAPWKQASFAEPTIVRDGLNEVEIAVNAPSTAMLVLNDTWAPGWRAYVDGAEQPVLRVNYLSRGVVVPGGAHRVLFQYRPSWVIAGLMTSLVCCMVVFGLMVAMVARAFRAPRAVATPAPLTVNVCA